MDREDGFFGIRVAKQGEMKDDGPERRQMEDEDDAIVDARLYDCVVRWDSLSEEMQERCAQRARILSASN